MSDTLDPKTKREFVIEVKIVVDGETPQELFDTLGGTIDNIRDTLCEYGRVDEFKLYERALFSPAQPGRDLMKVRQTLTELAGAFEGEEGTIVLDCAEWGPDVRAALAELDAQPKAVGVPPNVRELVSLLLWKIRNNQGSIAIEHYGGLLIEAQKEIDCWPERVEKGE